MDKKCVGRNGEFLKCDDFEARTRRCFETDGVIVKIAEDRLGVKGERRSVFRTAKYQLSHASIRTDVKRPHAVFWFGVCSYRKLKFKYVRKKASCPLCSGELHRLIYCGSKYFVTDKNNPDFKYHCHDDLEEDGRCVWEEVVRVGWRGSGSYED